MTSGVTIDRDGIERARAQLHDARARGVAWLRAHVGRDGEPAGAREVNGYYRLPWTLAFLGERELAAAVLSWIEREALTPGGDLRPAAREPFVTEWAAYPLALIAQGAWVLERYDTALAVMETLRAFQDPVTGGAYMERPEARRTGWQCIVPTAQLGFTALTTGQRDIADAAFRWLRALLRAQPELPRRLYAAWDAAGLVTAVDEDDAFVLVTDIDRPGQAFYNPSIAAAFLSRYALRTGEVEAAALARELVALAASACDEQYDHERYTEVCKLGWASAALLELDGDLRHLARIARMARWYADAQRLDGSWGPSPFRVPRPGVGDLMAKTAEHVLWVGVCLAALGDDRGAPHGGAPQPGRRAGDDGGRRGVLDRGIDRHLGNAR